MTGPRAFWREIKVGALRATEPPSWIPGQDCEPGRTDTEGLAGQEQNRG